MKNDGKEEKKKFWNKMLIVVVILGIIVGYLSYLQDEKMNKMLEELDRKKMEQIDPSEIQNLPDDELDKLVKKTFRIDQPTLRELDGVGDLLNLSWNYSMLRSFGRIICLMSTLFPKEYIV